MFLRSSAAVVVFFLCATTIASPGCTAQQSPEAAASAYFDALKQQKWLAAAQLMHPDALAKFRALITPAAQRDPNVRSQLFGPTISASELAGLTDDQLYARFLKTTMTNAPALAAAMAESRTEVIGSIADGPDVVQVTFRLTIPVQGQSVTRTDVMSFKRTQRGWGGLLRADIENLGARLSQ